MLCVMGHLQMSAQRAAVGFIESGAKAKASYYDHNGGFWVGHNRAGPSDTTGKGERKADDPDQEEFSPPSRRRIFERLKRFRRPWKPSQKPKKDCASSPPSTDAPGAPANPDRASHSVAPQHPSTLEDVEPGERRTTPPPSSGRSGARIGLRRIFRSSQQYLPSTPEVVTVAAAREHEFVAVAPHRKRKNNREAELQRSEQEQQAREQQQQEQQHQSTRAAGTSANASTSVSAAVPANASRSSARGQPTSNSGTGAHAGAPVCEELDEQSASSRPDSPAEPSTSDASSSVEVIEEPYTTFDLFVLWLCCRSL
ncbi:hypothetical protein BS17DRAFT_565230 [Gyrodon lividus]|nr:hypothetical protein BS17DRAFT_565230 [Gyrodon lividus]